MAAIVAIAICGAVLAIVVVVVVARRKKAATRIGDKGRATGIGNDMYSSIGAFTSRTVLTCLNRFVPFSIAADGSSLERGGSRSTWGGQQPLRVAAW